MALLLFLILLHLNVKLTSAYFLNKEETSISIELIKKLQIRQCILVENKKNEDLISDAKEFSSTNIPTAYLNYSLLIDYVDNNEAVYFFTGLIFKEENLNVLIGISEYFKKVSELGLGDSTLLSMLSFKTNKIYKLRNYVWLIFLKNYKNLNKLVVPYDCEFMVVHPENSTTYTVAEIYTVKNTFFSLNFGKWTRDLGFKTACGSFYRRRLDFQKSELTVDGYPIQGVRNMEKKIFIEILDIIFNISRKKILVT